jgi:SAM-dependent methyltransferase
MIEMMEDILLKNLNNSSDINREVFLSLLELNHAAKLVDLGGANGDFTSKCAEKIGTNNIVIADISIKCSEWREINFVKADLNENLPFSDYQFDVVISNQLLEHLIDVDKFLDEVYRILKPSGYAVISTPNLSSWDDIFALLLGYRPFSIDYSRVKLIGNPLSPSHHTDKSNLVVNGIFVGHNKIFTYKALEEIFVIHGFKIEKILGAGYIPFYLKFLMKILSRLDSRHSKNLIIKVRKEV